jgi:PAS domain S-box-containing protein
MDIRLHCGDDDGLYRQYWDEMPCYLSVHDPDYRIVDGNRRFRDDFGDAIGEKCFAVYKGRGDVCPDCPVAATFHDGSSHCSEQLLLTRTGRQVPVIVHTTPIRNQEGEVVAVMEMHSDISEAKRLERLLHQSQERLAQLFEEVPCLVTVQGRDHVIQHANRRFRETFGEATGRKCYEVYKHRHEQCLVCPMQATLDDGEIREHEEVLTAKDGRKLNMLCTTAPIRESDGSIRSVIEMSVDITQIRDLQSQLASIGLLVGSISHGIKGLLTGLDGGIYMVNSGFEKDRPERVTKGWEMVQRIVDRIRSMVLDILYYAKDRELQIEAVDVGALVAEIAEGLKKKASDADVTVRGLAAPEVGCVQGDAAAIRAMLLNLAENSLDACRMDSGATSHTVELAVCRRDDWVEFRITDDGVGMDRETQEKAFSLFFSSKGMKGTGLGLFIANKIAEKHGGLIEVESEPGEGTAFRVLLPIEAQPSVQPGNLPEGTTTDVRLVP